MFRNLFVAAMLAALCAGLVFSIVQQARLSPLIYAAESFEGAPHTHEGETEAHAHGDAAAGHSHSDEEWVPQDGTGRVLYTLLANVLAAAGYALVIGAVSVLAGMPISAANGALWGLGGFVTFMLAPGFGLPPGLPLMAIAETADRQIWWWGTALATGLGILIYAKWRAAWTLLVAVTLIAIPHLIGAPQPPAEATPISANLASSFTASVLFANAAMWVTLGLAFGYAADWLSHRRPAAAPQGATA